MSDADPAADRPLLPRPGRVGDRPAQYPSVWVCDEDRFQWYCDRPSETPPDPLAEKPALASKEDEAVAVLKTLREDLERKRALAIVQPTPANLRRYIAAQEALMDRAALFSDVWRRVLWAHPELNYQLRNPVNNAAIQVRDAQQAGKERAALAGLGRDWGCSSSSAPIVRTAIAWRRPSSGCPNSWA